MSFIKNVASSFVGSSLAFLLSGTILIFIFIGALVGGVVGAIGDADTEEEVVSTPTVLHITLSDALVERSSNAPSFEMGPFADSGGLGMNSVKEGLIRAASDENVEGIFLNLSSVGASPSTLQDLRRALLEFKESGKWILAWSETTSIGAAYLNSVADEVYLHPNGYTDFSGLRLQTTYFTGMLEKLGVEMTVLRGPDNAYKSAVEPFLRKSMSAPNREQLTALLDDIWSEIRGSLAEGRALSPDQVDAMAENLQIRVSQDAVDLGLIDGLFYEDEVKQMMEDKVGETPAYTSLQEYGFEDQMESMFAGLDFLEIWNSAGSGEVEESELLGGNLAVIYAVGAIESGEGDDQTIGSETIAGALRQARLAPDVKAVVLRVNSPGGSALASDVIWRETQLLKEAGKTLVVSMGDVAASGGYYISAGADRIFANETTITGSIGVFGMLPHAGELLKDKMGLAYDDVRSHSHAGVGLDAPLDDVQMAAMNASISDIYEDFISLVADGRGMSISEVDAMARGRVWSGVDALEMGLVDELGNLEDAIAAAAGLAELDSLEQENIVYLPEMLDPIQALIEELGGVETTVQLLASLGFSKSTIREYIGLQRMVVSDDLIQARMPFLLDIR